jgi:hypothetical protein
LRRDDSDKHGDRRPGAGHVVHGRKSSQSSDINDVDDVASDYDG